MNEASASRTATRFKVRALSPLEFDNQILSAWKDLDSRALEANPFLSPNFVLPSIKYLDKGKTSHLLPLFVEKVSNGTTELTGVAVFYLSKPSKFFPLPHLKAFGNQYSFLSGYLVDCEHAVQTMEALFGFLSRPQGKWHSLVLHDRAADGPLAQIEQETAAAFGMRWASFHEWDRAALRPAEITDGLNSAASKNSRKTVRRRMKRLEGLGPVTWVLRHRDNLTPEVIETFLGLENQGWKKEQSTSLLSNPEDAAFFKEMIANFREDGLALVTELNVNAEPIASNVVLLSGQTAFGFKLGWNIEYYKYSPGFLSVSQWLDNKTVYPGKLEFIDSSSAEDATYMNELWPHRRRLRSGAYAITDSGKLALPLVELAARLKNAMRKKARASKKTQTD